jgi:transcriptional regulator with PAS, ATPase and Fis domain
VANKPKLNVELGKYGLVGNSKSMQKLYHIIDKSSSNQATVLIQGESGTGKELVARAIHYNSKYHQAPFVPINCGQSRKAFWNQNSSAIPKALLLEPIPAGLDILSLPMGAPFSWTRSPGTSLSMQV